jgi:hypothetical protein
MGKRDGKTSEKVDKPNSIVQYRYMRSEDRAYRYLSYYLVVRESEVVKESGMFSSKLCFVYLMCVDLCIIVLFIKKIQQDATLYQNFILPYLSEVQHVSVDTPPIIRSLKLHWQPLVFQTWKVVWTCSWWTLSSNNLLRMIKPESASAVFGS